MQKKLRASLAVIIASLSSVTLQFGQTNPRVRKMIAYVKRITASELDSKLTAEPFGRWLTRIAGPDAAIAWEVNDCGEQTGSPADRLRDIPVCVQAEMS